MVDFDSVWHEHSHPVFLLRHFEKLDESDEANDLQDSDKLCEVGQMLH